MRSLNLVYISHNDVKRSPFKMQATYIVRFFSRDIGCYFRATHGMIDKNERVSYMQITATELKTNIGRYLVLAEKQDIIITKNNRPIAKLTNVQEDKISILDSLIGIIPDNGFALEEAKGERLARQ